VSDLWISLILVPERYDINAGSIGKIHGEINEPNPANAETRILVSSIPDYATWDYPSRSNS
jgi:hypothetical protein